jgi:hypothetical protein
VPVTGLRTTIFQFAQFDVERQLLAVRLAVARRLSLWTSPVYLTNLTGGVLSLRSSPTLEVVPFLTDLSASQAFFLMVGLGFVPLDDLGFHHLI